MYQAFCFQGECPRWRVEGGGGGGGGKGTFFRFQVHERLEFSQVELYKRSMEICHFNL